MNLFNKKIVFISILIATVIALFLFNPQKANSDQVVIDENINSIEPTLTLHAKDLARAIVATETNWTFKCHPGLSGEQTCYQFMPSTFRGYALELLGYVPELTEATAQQVTELKIEQWLKSGMTDEQIFLIWNQGNTSKCKSGVNRYGVPFDSCAYVRQGLLNLEKVIHSRM